MFLNLANTFVAQGKPATSVFLVHPVQLSRWLDEAWTAGALVPPLPGVTPPNAAPLLGASQIIEDLNLPTQAAGGLIDPSGISVANPDNWSRVRGPLEASPGSGGLIWHQLIYAYLVESTGVMEIFSEVVRRMVLGETLGSLSPESVKWLRSTEELFFRDPPLFSIGGVISEMRPYARVNRRNAYWRMFGLDLPHQIPSIWGGATTPDAWKQGVGSGVNLDFREKWTELLRQVWMGLENRKNAAGVNPTDPSYVALLCRAIRDMLNQRRQGGALAREEFAYVSALSWFDLTLRSDSPIVKDLKAQASTPDGRLTAIAERVGMKSATRSRELLEMAELSSSVLRAIELGIFDDPVQAEALYSPASQLTEDMNDLINLWQSATGDRVKERPTGTAVTASAQPLRVPRPELAATRAGA